MALSPTQVDSLVVKAREQIDQNALVDLEAYVDSALLEAAKAGIEIEGYTVDLTRKMPTIGKMGVTVNALAAIYRKAGWKVRYDNGNFSVQRKHRGDTRISVRRTNPSKSAEPW